MVDLINTTVADLVGAGNEKTLVDAINLKLATTNPLVQAGLLATNPVYNQYLGMGPRTWSMQHLNALPTDELNVASDDINQEGKTAGLNGGEHTAVKHIVNMGFATTDLTSMVTSRDTLGDLRNGISDFWIQQYLDIAIATFLGAKNAVAALSASGTAPAFTVDNFLSAIIDAQAGKDERIAPLDVAIITPEHKAILQKGEKNAYVPASQTDIGFDQYAGVTLVTTRRLPGLPTMFASRGSLAFAARSARNDGEIGRRDNGGNGQGGDVLHSRREIMAMPSGFQWKGPVRSGDDKATLVAELKKAANWALIPGVSADQVPFAFKAFA